MNDNWSWSGVNSRWKLNSERQFILVSFILLHMRCVSSNYRILSGVTMRNSDSKLHFGGVINNNWSL